MGCDRLVTGHYARITEENGIFRLKKALDESKDQSYFLYNLTQDQLAHILFPLGGFSKKETREIASALHLPTAHKPESQDICFIPDGDYAALVEACAGKPCPPGRFIDRSGRTLGRHRGIIHYTIGQRRGLVFPLPNRFTFWISVRKTIRSFSAEKWICFRRKLSSRRSIGLPARLRGRSCEPRPKYATGTGKNRAALR